VRGTGGVPLGKGGLRVLRLELGILGCSISMAVQAVDAFLQSSHVRTVFLYCVHDRF